MRLRHHWQNLRKEDKKPGQPSRHAVHARGWLNWGRGAGPDRSCFRWELVVWRGRVGLGVEWGGFADDDVELSLGCWLFAVYLGLSSRLTRRLGRLEHREIDVAFHDQAVYWNLVGDPHEWSSTTPRWRRGSWHPLDTLFGRTKHFEETLSTTRTHIPMPERAYPATVTLRHEWWKRPRLPFRSHDTVRAHIDVEGGVPHPGKGENAWDCGEDATFSLCCEAHTVEEGIAKFVESVMRSRRRHGGSVNWQPEAQRA